MILGETPQGGSWDSSGQGYNSNNTSSRGGYNSNTGKESSRDPYAGYGGAAAASSSYPTASSYSGKDGVIFCNSMPLNLLAFEQNKGGLVLSISCKDHFPTQTSTLTRNNISGH